MKPPPLWVAVHADLHPGHSKDKMPFHHEGVCGIACICATP